MDEGLALVLGGGGMRCAYGAGVLLALGENFSVREPSIGIASSGGVGSFSYYLSGQYEQLRRAWEGDLCSRRVINLYRFWRIFDIDYLVDEIFKKKERLDLDRLNSKKTRFFISATNAKTGQLEYFLANSGERDIFQLMRASKSIPVFSGYGKRVHLDTYDNGLLGDNVRKAFEEGARKVVVISNGETDGFVRKVFGLWFKFQTKEFKKNFLSNFGREVERKEDVFYMHPRRTLEIGTLGSNEEILKRTYCQGYEDASSDNGLRAFLDS